MARCACHSCPYFVRPLCFCQVEHAAFQYGAPPASPYCMRSKVCRRVPTRVAQVHCVACILGFMQHVCRMCATCVYSKCIVLQTSRLHAHCHGMAVGMDARYQTVSQLSTSMRRQYIIIRESLYVHSHCSSVCCACAPLYVNSWHGDCVVSFFRGSVFLVFFFLLVSAASSIHGPPGHIPQLQGAPGRQGPGLPDLGGTLRLHSESQVTRCHKSCAVTSHMQSQVARHLH